MAKTSLSGQGPTYANAADLEATSPPKRPASLICAPTRRLAEGKIHSIFIIRISTCTISEDVSSKRRPYARSELQRLSSDAPLRAYRSLPLSHSRCLMVRLPEGLSCFCQAEPRRLSRGLSRVKTASFGPAWHWSQGRRASFNAISSSASATISRRHLANPRPSLATLYITARSYFHYFRNRKKPDR